MSRRKGAMGAMGGSGGAPQNTQVLIGAGEAPDTGLKPEAHAAGADATYMIAGHIVNSSDGDARTLYTTEGIGRDGQAKARRKLACAEGDVALKRLLERDKDGMRPVILAWEAGKEDVASRGAKGAKGKERGAGKGKGKGTERGAAKARGE
ncbi:hypothetical protein HYPSUDRAFT_220984 [Hypholoma sublateritium FD-334 SS-4]|uniref:Uncharacterized protein n=1 Tax=Hypholoma sublateritium (strain FD-334 SS-4) TaxID=945553 RepID=A0A0D2N825_HYPSF|nr:hypothetical protein HYPSUDRAFT_220984 [Hypholoma sublateritium FD-334 SS-4]